MMPGSLVRHPFPAHALKNQDSEPALRNCAKDGICIRGVFDHVV